MDFSPNSVPPAHPSDDQIYTLEGDITRLEVDAIVNATNKSLTRMYTKPP